MTFSGAAKARRPILNALASARGSRSRFGGRRVKCCDLDRYASAPASLRPSPHIHVRSFGRFDDIVYLVEKAFAHIGRRMVWRGSGKEEKGVDATDGRVLVEVDPRYFRPTA